MPRGIIINGAAGTGKTTLAEELARRLAFQHLELDDYYFHGDAAVPFSSSPPREEIRQRLMRDLSKQTHFVMSGTIGSIVWDLVNPLFDLAVLLMVPSNIRMARLRERGDARHGQRILPGGDMYESYREFLRQSESYETGVHPAVPVTLERHNRWAAELSCPVFRLDGTKPMAENAGWLVEKYLSMAGEALTP